MSRAEMMNATTGAESRCATVKESSRKGKLVSTATRRPPPMLMWPTSALPAELRKVLLYTTALLGGSGVMFVVITAPTVLMLLLSASSCVASVMLTLHLAWTYDAERSVLVLSVYMVVAVVLASIAFTFSAQPLSALATGLPFAFVIARGRPLWLPVAAAGIAAFSASAITAALDNDAIPAREGLMILILTGAATVAFTATFASWQLHLQLDRYNADQRELVLTRERLRFATDLHDIQGHSLLAIKLKAELARRNLRRDPRVTERELQSIEELAVEAGDRTRDLAHGYRALPLTTELVNVEQLLNSAGIAVEIRMQGTPPQDQEHLFTELTREATSNILRHADATEVDIQVSPSYMTVSNNISPTAPDTPAAREPRPGHGLAGLQQRFAESGGSFEWMDGNDCFTVTGKLEVAP